MTSPAQVHVDSALTDFATSYKNGAFIADKISPPVQTDKLSGKYFTRNRKDVSTPIDDLLSARGKANEVSYDVSTSSYALIDRGLKQPVSTDIESNADAPLDPRQLATQNVMQRIMLNRETRVATLINTQANWASTNTGAVSYKWSDETNGTPLTDLQTAIQAVATDGEDSRLIAVCALPVYHALAKHPQMLGLRAGGGQAAGMLSTSEINGFLGLDDFFVSRVRSNSANESQTASYGWIFSGTQFVILQVPKTLQGNDLQIFAATFMSRGGVRIRQWRDESEGFGGSEIIQAEYRVFEGVAQNDQGYQLRGVL